MENQLENYSVRKISESETAFLNRNDIYQDGTVPFCRDSSGKLWAISGHTNIGHIGVFCGNTLSDMKEMWPAEFKFQTGAAGKAFLGIKYPEGVMSRGSIWPFGLYIAKNTGRFFCFFHNETGWNGEGTAYDSLGLCASPKLDSDFRHIGLMHSDDEGRTWYFDRWVLTAENVCFTEEYVPENINVKGQKKGTISLGAGDFSLFIPPDSDPYIYIFYNIVKVDMNEWLWRDCSTYVARTRKRDDGIMGDFVKFYDGSFSEPGNFGKETHVTQNTWHSRVVYSEKLHKFIMSSAPMNPGSRTQVIGDFMELRTSEDMLSWSEPVSLHCDGKIFGNHYNAICSFDGCGNPYIATDEKFSVLTCHNGTDVIRTDWEIF